MPGHQSGSFRVAWSDGQRIVSAGSDDSSSNGTLRPPEDFDHERPNDWIDAVVWSSDGTRLATRASDNSVRVLGVRSPARKRSCFRGTRGCSRCRVAPRRLKLAAASSTDRSGSGTQRSGSSGIPHREPALHRARLRHTRQNAERLRWARHGLSITGNIAGDALWARLWKATRSSVITRAQHRYPPPRRLPGRGRAGKDEAPFDDAAKRRSSAVALTGSRPNSRPGQAA